MTVLKQAVELIPVYLIPKLARKHKVDKKSRSFSVIPQAARIPLLSTVFEADDISFRKT